MARTKTPNAALPDVPGQLSDAEIANAFSGCCDAGILRGLIEAEIRFIRAGGQRDIRTLRGFWYFVVKSALSRTGLLNKKTPKGNAKDWPAALSSELEDMVSDGVTTYEELQIIDGSRQRSVARSMNHTVAETQWVGPHYPWVIIFTEKDTIWPVLNSIAQLYGVSAISCGGEPAASCTEDILKQIVRSEAFEQHFPGTVQLLGLTDYDPYGYHIFNAQREQIKRLFPMNEIDSKVTLNSERMGIYPNQVPPEELAVKTYAPKDEGLKKWFELTGGVNGRPLGIELDVLPIQQIRMMFAEAIESCTSLDSRREDLRRAFVEELAWETLMPEIEVRKKRLVDAVKSSPAWAKIQNTPISNEIFKEAAIEGRNVVDPRKVFDCADEVRAAMNKAKT